MCFARRGSIFFLSATLTTSSLLAQLGSSQPSNAPVQPNHQTNGGAVGAGMAGTMNGTTGAIDPVGQMMKDKLFIHNAIEDGIAQIRIGELASRNGGSNEVKQLGQKLADDYSSLNDNLARVADTMNSTVPTRLNKKDRIEHDKLRSMAGEDFDREYLAYAGRVQIREIRDFRTKDESTPDSELKTTVDTGLQVLQQHTQMIEDLRKQKTVPISDHRTAPVATPSLQPR